MPEERSAPATKRGRRKVAAPAAEGAVAKKRPLKEVEPVDNGEEDGEKPPKRGKGRPKSVSKKAAPKAKSAPVGRRGRSKKEENAKHSEEDKNENEDVDV